MIPEIGKSYKIDYWRQVEEGESTDDFYRGVAKYIEFSEEYDLDGVPLYRMECEDGEFGLFADEDIVEEIAEEKLTEEKTSAYLAKPNHCPYCDSRNIEAGALAAEDNIVLVSGVKCLNCHKTWSDVYTLTRIIEN